jgi:hypothetical protein
VFRWGRYTTRMAHDEPYVRLVGLRLVTVGTLSPMCLANVDGQYT